MNVLKIILIIGLYQTIILGGIILLKRNKNLPDFFLAAMFLVYGITLFLGYMEIYNRENNYPFPFLIHTSSPFILLHGPFLWFYIKSLTSQHFRFKSKYLLHFIPFVLVAFLMIMGIYRLPYHERIIIDSSEAFKNTMSFPFVIGMIAIFTQGYFIWGLLLIKDYTKRIQNYFSEISLIDLAWLRILLYTCIIFYAGNSLLYMADFMFNIFSYQVLQSVGYSYASLFILVLGYRGFRQGNVFASQPLVLDVGSNLRDAIDLNSLDEKDKNFVDQLLLYMENEKPYLSPDLTLSALATNLNVNPNYLSATLNGKLNKNFFDFVNFYRVEEFKKNCNEGIRRNYSIMGMAWDAGFNSKATFNRVFKTITGTTPGGYMKNLKE